MEHRYSDGAAVIERVRQAKPADYVKMIASLLPKDVNLKVRPLDDLSDEQLLLRLLVLIKQAAPLLARVAENDGASDGSPVSRTSTSTISATRF